MVQQLGHTDFDREWARCAHLLQPALDRDPTHSLDEVRTLCLQQPDRFQFWPGTAAAAVTQIVEQPYFRDAHIWLAGGDLAELETALPSVEAFGRAAGCIRLTVWGRKGFARALAPRGYRTQFVALAKDLRQ